MKHYVSHSPSEQAAHQLWGQFTRQKQESFWQQYEALLATHQNTSEVPPVSVKPVIQKSPRTNKPSLSKSNGRKESFSPAPKHYLASLSMAGVFIFITIFFVRSFTQSNNESGIGPFLIFYLIIAVIYVLLALWVNEFKTDQRYLYIYKPLLFFSLYEKWDNIQTIIIEKDLSGEGGISQTLTIKTYQQETRQYTYQLSGERHEAFLKHLEKKVSDVQLRVKCIPNVGLF